MANYTTVAKIKERYTSAVLTELLNDESDVDTAIQNFIDRAEDKIDAFYKAGGWSVPLSTVPEGVQVMCEEIAVYMIYARRNRVPDMIRQDYQDAMTLLRQISTQEQPVQDDDDLVIPTSTDEASSIIFNFDDMEDKGL